MAVYALQTNAEATKVSDNYHSPNNIVTALF